ncbi:MAG: dienelactone hydrolase family protein [Actinomycetota bacterium]
MAAPSTGAVRGGVIVVQEGFGLTGHISSSLERLAADGWIAVAPALYHRFGSPVFDYSDPTGATAAMGRLAGDEVDSDVDVSADILVERGVPRTRQTIIGFCLGGTVAFHTAVRGTVAAAVSFYGGGIRLGRFGQPCLLDQAPGLKSPWLGLYGDQDPYIASADVEALRDVVAQTAAKAEIARYPTAGHGFTSFDRADYDADAAADAWRRCLDWLRAHVA